MGTVTRSIAANLQFPQIPPANALIIIHFGESTRYHKPKRRRTQRHILIMHTPLLSSLLRLLLEQHSLLIQRENRGEKSQNNEQDNRSADPSQRLALFVGTRALDMSVDLFEVLAGGWTYRAASGGFDIDDPHGLDDVEGVAWFSCDAMGSRWQSQRGGDGRHFGGTDAGMVWRHVALRL